MLYRISYNNFLVFSFLLVYISIVLTFLFIYESYVILLFWRTKKYCTYMREREREKELYTAYVNVYLPLHIKTDECGLYYKA